MLSKGWDAKKQLRVFSFVFILLAVVLISGSFVSAVNAPQGVTAQIIHNEVHLQWDEVEGADEYRVYKSTDNSTFNMIANGTFTSYVDDNVTAGTTYYYKVAAYNATDGENTSAVLEIKIIPPAAPSSLSVKYENGSVVLTWKAVNNATGYYIYRGVESGNLSVLATSTNTTYTDTAVTEGNTYYYAVSAYNDTGESSLTTEISITIPESSGSGTVQFDDSGYIVFNTILLYFGVLMILVGVPIYFFGTRSHKDVAFYAVLVGIIALIISWSLAYYGIQYNDYKFLGLTFNGLLAWLGVAFVAVGIVLYLFGYADRNFANRRDVAAFSIVFGLLALLMSYVVQYLL